MRRFRNALNMSQDDLSESLAQMKKELSTGQISKVENGIHLPEASIMDAIATIFSKSLADMFTLDGAISVNEPGFQYRLPQKRAFTALNSRKNGVRP